MSKPKKAEVPKVARVAGVAVGARASKVAWKADSNLAMFIKKGDGLWVANRKLGMSVKESVGKTKK